MSVAIELTPRHSGDIQKGYTPQWLFRNAPPKEFRPGKPEAIVWEGEFFQDFFNAYLQGYIDRIPQYYPEGAKAAQEILPVLQEFLPLVKKCPLVKQQDTISGVAYAMLFYHITQAVESQGRLPPRHWDFRPKYAKEAQKCRKGGRIRAAEFLETLASDPDIDEKWGMNGHNMGEVVTWLHQTLQATRKYQLSELDEAGATPDVKVKKEYQGATFDLVYSENIRIRFIGGKLPHNEKIEVFSIWVCDRNGEGVGPDGKVVLGKRLFHFESRNIPSTAEDMAYDFRGGMTFSQDLVVAHTQVIDDKIRYALPQKAVEEFLYQDRIILKPDKIDSENENSLQEAMLSETPVRLARLRQRHNVGFVWIRDDKGQFKGVLAVPNREFIWPWLFNILELATRMRELDVYHIGIDQRRKLLLAQELVILMDDNPWLTREFIQQSGLFVRTRWKDKNPEDFARLAANLAMVVEPMEKVAGPRDEQLNDPIFQFQQMQLYLELQEMNGLEMLMRADDKRNTGREIEAYLNLLDIPEGETQVIDTTEDIPPNFRTRSKIVFPEKDGSQTIYLVSDKPITSGDKAKIGHRLEQLALPEPEIFTTALKHLSVVIDTLRGTLLGVELSQGKDVKNGTDIFTKLIQIPTVIYTHLVDTTETLKRNPLDLFEGSMQSVLDVCIYLEIVARHPGITPRTLEKLYGLYTKNPGQQPAREAEYTLKRRMHDLLMTGLVRRRSMMRVEKSGNIVPVEFLSLREPFRIHRFSELITNRDFRIFWATHALNQSLGSDTATNQLDILGRELSDNMIPSVQAVENMTEKDWDVIQGHIAIKDYEGFRERVRKIHQVAREFLEI